ASGCDSILTVVVTATSAAGEPTAAIQLHFSPNPAVGETVVSWDNTQSFSQMRVFDIHGRLVLSQAVIASSGAMLKTSGWATGWYSVQLEGRDGGRAQGRLLVRH
ncbi:MAG: T9SS type A sorting domain-containing protein, partial [Saprospiraceae bacterium]